jgi:hypothetical protein
MQFFWPLKDVLVSRIERAGAPESRGERERKDRTAELKKKKQPEGKENETVVFLRIITIINRFVNLYFSDL